MIHAQSSLSPRWYPHRPVCSITVSCILHTKLESAIRKLTVLIGLVGYTQAAGQCASLCLETNCTETMSASLDAGFAYNFVFIILS